MLLDYFWSKKYLSAFFSIGLVLAILVTGSNGLAKTKKVRKANRGQDAIVSVEGAAVYKFANFDAPIMEYFEQGKRVKISKKKYQGIGGLGDFYKVRVRSGVYGYITDIDVSVSESRISTGSARETQVRESQQPPKDPWGDSPPEENGQAMNGDPLYYRRFVGINVGMHNFTETIGDQQEAESTMVFGVKASGPGALFDGPPIDFEFNLSPSAPSYYKKITSQGASGFFVIGHLALVLPLSESSIWYSYYGAGLNYVYTKFDVATDNNVLDSQELRLGVAGLLGAAVQLGPSVLVRVEGKYYYEKAAYPGASLAIQTGF